MNRQQKKDFVDSFNKEMSEAGFMVLFDYKGVTVAQFDSARRDFESKGVQMRIVKNTLAKKSIAELECSELTEHFSGMTGVAFSAGDPIASAKVIRDILLAKESPFTVKAGFFEGSVLNEDGIVGVASMPGREELLSQLLATIQEAPRQVLGVIQGPARDLLYLLRNYESKLAEDGATE